ncbi:MFS transporter [Curtobacterium sp. ISL-83]|uniref:MFS transporter n=1 Tax=Curtobacterium sp. ISL-83 TaxID=2819145 RepID=UPI001BECBDC5|nr:MFS transporter [Curtobacterium sp. ISL-83]MBT2501698.1 MFS transporter [Curtobacterium sp. ISL-83]
MASYLDAAAIAGTGTALVLYQKPLGLSGGDIGLLSALLTFSIAIGALVGGRLGDRFGRRRVFALTMILFALGALLLTLALTPSFIYIGLVVLGLASGADLPVSLSMIGEAAPAARRGQMIGLSHGLWVVGIVATILIGISFGALGETGARVIYAHLLVVSILVLIFRAGIPESAKWKRAEDTRTASIAVGGGTDIGALKQLLSSRFIVPVVALGLFFAIANISANTNGQFQTYVYVNVAGLDVPTASLFGLISIGVGFVSLFMFMRLVDGERTRQFMLWGAALLATVGFLLPAVLGVHAGTIITSTILYSVGGGIIGEPMYKVWSQEIIPVLFRSSVQGVTIAFTRTIAAVVALVTPAIIATGATNLYWFLTGTTVVAAALGLFWLPRFRRADDEAGIDETGSVAIHAAPSTSSVIPGTATK